MNSGHSPTDGHSHAGAGIACGIGAGALWGLVFLAPELTPQFTPLQLAIGRYFAYGVMALALIAPRLRRLAEGLSGRDWIALGWLALTGNTLYYVLLAAAVQQGGIAMTSLIVGFLPVTVTIIGSRDHGAVPLSKLAPSLILCALGVGCISWQALLLTPSSGANGQLFGLICAFGSLLVWTVFAVYNSRCLAKHRHISAHDWNLLIGIVTGAQAIALIPISAFTDSLPQQFSAWVHFAAVSIAIAVLASIFGNALWNRMSRLLPLTMVGQMILFETLFALIYGLIWEQRLPRTLEVTAFIFVVASVLSCIAVHRRHQPAIINADAHP